MGFEPTVPVKVRRFSRPFRYDHFGISPFVALTFYHIISELSRAFLKKSDLYLRHIKKPPDMGGFSALFIAYCFKNFLLEIAVNLILL